ncbi:MAG: 3-isopropylmalate dehydratase small subunit [Planctomycetes bacterium]|nr:3-isopropylmalate dehydratase small subunit [Planctomycetota bacterium]
MISRVWKYGNNINTDVIFPGKYTYTLSEPAELAEHALEDLDPEFAKKVQTGDVIVAGRNFGCGSSREQAASCLKYAGVSAIIAESFARIFFRNAINFGLPVITCPQAVSAIKNDDVIEINFAESTIKLRELNFIFPILAPEVLEILNSGGLIQYARKKISNKPE